MVASLKGHADIVETLLAGDRVNVNTHNKVRIDSILEYDNIMSFIGCYYYRVDPLPSCGHH